MKLSVSFCFNQHKSKFHPILNKHFPKFEIKIPFNENKVDLGFHSEFYSNHKTLTGEIISSLQTSHLFMYLTSRVQLSTTTKTSLCFPFNFQNFSFILIASFVTQISGVSFINLAMDVTADFRHKQLCLKSHLTYTVTGPGILVIYQNSYNNLSK